MKSIYYKGAVISGLATAGITMYHIHPELKNMATDVVITTSEYKRGWSSYNEYWDYWNPLPVHDTCASRIVNRFLSYPSYALDQTFSYKPFCNFYGWASYFGIQGCAGILSGAIIGATWPVSVPLIGLHVAETKYGFKFC
jgi:hypothetical protein